jgi:hypothetical protein
MPKTHHGRRKRPVKSPRRALDHMRRMLLDIDEPLNDAIDYVQSLRLIGGAVLYGYDDSGRAILAVTSAASERLDDLKKIWNRIHAAGRREPDKRRRKRV